MSDSEVRELREQMNHMERKLLTAISDWKIHVAENYVSKEEYRNDQTGKRSGISNTFMGAGILISLIMGIIGIFVK